MKRFETLETLFRKVDLSFAGKVLKEARVITMLVVAQAAVNTHSRMANQEA